MRKLTFTTGALAAALATFGVVDSAHAWHYPPQFASGPWIGAGGNYYTGSPRSEGIACTSCHTGTSSWPPNQRVQMNVTTRRVQGGSLVPDDIFANGYTPGARYKITIAMVGEHRGRDPSDGMYQGPGGSPWKVACPTHAFNRNHLTAEVMNEAEVYASFAGNAAGTLRADANSNVDSTQQASACLSSGEGCTTQFAELPEIPPRGGPTTVSYRIWRLTDPSANPPFGQWSCTSECDAIVTNEDNGTTPLDRTSPFGAVNISYFWTAPNPAPTAGNGRIRFYMAMVDGDGLSDTFDDDFAEFRRAACPAGNASCNPTNPPWNFTVAPPAPVAPTAPRVDTRPPASPLWVLSLLAIGALVVLGFSQRGGRRWAAATASVSLVVLVGALGSGCVMVKPWERGRMATLVMSKGPDVEEAMVERTFLESREGSSGGSAASAGGGCACN